MEQVKKILWIDDDINRIPLMPFVDEFKEKGFTIIGVENPDEINEKLCSNQCNFQCIIVDISMPLGEIIQFGEAKGGMQTGFVILKKLVETPELNEVKKVVFTIVDDAEVRTYCKSLDPQISYLPKHKYFTDTFVNEIENIINN